MQQRTLHIPYIPELDPAICNNANDDAITMLDRRGSRCLIDSLNWANQYPYAPLTSVTAGHSGTTIFIDFFVRCNYLRAVNDKDLSPVSQDSCVEFFVSPDPNDTLYWNFEFNCIGTLNASFRRERAHPTRLTPEQLKRVIRRASCGNRPFCEIEGMFTWNILIAIPLDLLGIKYRHGIPVIMTGNLNKCASATSAPHYLSWNPIDTPTPDFHRPEFFGKIILD